MTSTTLIRPCGIDNFDCLEISDAGQQQFIADSERLTEAGQQSSLILLAPAELVHLRSASFDPAERKMLRKTLPFALEDELLDDVDELHFSLGTLAEQSVPVAIVKKSSLGQWLDATRDQGLEISQLVSELQCLPLLENSWTLFVDVDPDPDANSDVESDVAANSRWLLRYGEAEGFALEMDTAALALQLLVDNAEQCPERLHLYCPAEQRAAISAQLPALLRDRVAWQASDYWSVLASTFNKEDSSTLRVPQAINLLQGEYAPNLPWNKWWLVWRSMLVLFAVALIVQFASAFMQMQHLDERNITLRAAIESSYRSVFPRGAVLEPERKLRREVEALAGGGGAGFMSSFQPIARAAAAIEGLSLHSVNYSDKLGEIRLNILANDFKDVEVFRAALQSAGMRAELSGTSAEGDQTRARLKVRR